MRRKRGTGTITAHSGGFVARLPDQERSSLGVFPTYAEAETGLNAACFLLASGEVSSAKTLDAYGKRVLDRRELDGYRGVQQERSRWKTHVTPWECSSWPLKAITKAHVLSWVRQLRAKKLSDQTIRNSLNGLRCALRSAVDDGLIDSNPCAEISVKSHGRTTDPLGQALTIDELVHLIANADVDGRHLIAFAAGTGLRQGELRALHTCDVHLDGDTPHVIVRYGSPKRPTKRGKSRRVPLFGMALAAAQSYTPGLTIFFPTVHGHYRPRGRVVALHAWKAWTKQFARRVRWHDLRHTCATQLLRGGYGEQWTLEEVRDMLGHSTIRVTERYAHFDGSLAEARAVRHRQDTKAPKSDRAPEQLAAEILEKTERRGWDLNPRMSVLQCIAEPSSVETLHALRALSVSLLERAARRDPACATRRLVRTAGEIVELIDLMPLERERARFG